MRIIVTGALVATFLTACAVGTEGANVGYTQTNNPSYQILDRFRGPDGEITLFCRNGDLFVDKNGVQSGSVQYFHEHEKCVDK